MLDEITLFQYYTIKCMGRNYFSYFFPNSLSFIRSAVGLVDDILIFGNIKVKFKHQYRIKKASQNVSESFSTFQSTPYEIRAERELLHTLKHLFVNP